MGAELLEELIEEQHVPAILADPSFVGWDPSFVENIARDGILLWARGELPVVLAPVAQRPLSAGGSPQV